MKRVLFIGNSFTYVNDLPGMLAALCEGADFALETQAVTRGGWYLSGFADPADPMGQELRKVYPTQNWDYIVLQDQSFNPAGDRENFLSAVKTLAGLMNGGARFLLYQTWAYQNGTEKLASTGLTYAAMRDRLREAYQAAADECGGVCVPVGDAFSLCREQYPDISLYTQDAYHPSPMGTYLAACLFFACVAQDSPLKLGAPEGLDGAQAALLRKIAVETLKMRGL